MDCYVLNFCVCICLRQHILNLLIHSVSSIKTFVTIMITLTLFGSLIFRLVLAGDGRCDSPGHCTKYGSYSLMEQHLNKVLHTELVQVWF